MRSRTAFNVWKGGEIYPTPVLAISERGFGSLSDLQGGWCFVSIPSSSPGLAMLLLFPSAACFNLLLNLLIRIFKT